MNFKGKDKIVRNLNISEVVKRNGKIRIDIFI